MCWLDTLLLASSTALSVDWFETRPIAAQVRDGSWVPPPVRDPSPADKAQVSQLLDFMHAELLKQSPDASDGDDIEVYDDFIAEGRKLLQISACAVCRGEDDDAVAHDVWGGVAALLHAHDGGLLVAMPEYIGDVKRYLNDEVLQPLWTMGWHPSDFNARGYRVGQGAPFPAFRILYSKD